MSGSHIAVGPSEASVAADPVASEPLPVTEWPPPHDPWTTRLRRAVRWLLAFSFPRSFPIVQFPNLPLALAFVAGQTASRTHGSVHIYANAISYLSMAVWAYLELFEGVNWFRRLLGAFYIASTAYHLERALAH